METANNQGSQKVQNIAAVDEAANGLPANINHSPDDDPVVQIGSNVVPVNVNDVHMMKGFVSVKHVAVYIGFEHWCPQGHRFMLRPDHLSDLGSPYAIQDESLVPSSIENSENKAGDPSKFGKVGGHAKARKKSNGTINVAVLTRRNLDESKARGTDKNVYENGQMQNSNVLTDQQTGDSKVASSVMDLGTSLQSSSLNDGGCAFSLLNRRTPIYMNCPHCRESMRKKDTTLSMLALFCSYEGLFWSHLPFRSF